MEKVDSGFDDSVVIGGQAKNAIFTPMRHLFSTLLLFVWASFARAQELPPILVFEPDEYQGGSQNWMLSQGAGKFIYSANNKGLLEFNGLQWTQYASPNETIIRAVRAWNGRIYTGCYMEFGYWERESTGQLAYHSLSEAVKDQLVADEQFWNILPYEQYLLFRSLDQIFLYDLSTEQISVLRPPSGLDRLFKVGQQLLFTGKDRRLYTLSQGEIKPMLEQALPGRRIVHLWKDGSDWLLQTTEAGRFRLSGNELKQVEQPEVLNGKSIYSACDLADGRQAFGTISDGVYLFLPDGQLQHHITQVEGLSNNTVLALFEDERHNLWAGTDNGISCINLAEPIRKYTDYSGRLGTVYAAAIHQGQLYLGTNQGLFRKPIADSSPFAFVGNTKGQVWSLQLHQGALFCGHDVGTFLVEDGRAQLLFSGSGTWKFGAVPGREDWLMQGNYYGLSVLERVGGEWRFRNKLEGFNYSARFFECRSPNEVYISHEYKGIFGLKVDPDFQRVEALNSYEYPPKGENVGLSTFDEQLLYASRAGIFRLQSFEEGFVRDSSLSQVLLGDEYESGKMTVDEQGQLWVFAKHNLYYFRRDALSQAPKPNAVPIPLRLIKAMSGYENITQVATGRYLMGMADGYLLLDLREMPRHEHLAHWAQISSYDPAQNHQSLPLSGSEIKLPYASNSLLFEFAVPVYSKYFAPQFQYRLEGFYDQWSEWSPASALTFENLPFGTYRLELRTKVGHQRSSNTLVYEFCIMRPWYWSWLAIAIYTLLALLLTYFVHSAYTRYYRQQRTQLQLDNQRQLQAQQRESEMALIRISNDQLQRDIESKNRELAASTMSLVKKNELLLQIKGELEAGGDSSNNIRAVLKTIDRNTDENETWNFFREAFENADQDFFKKVQDKHPKLTHNDLKMCAYLRLNLSSKEIAPLLNISVRSVEVKRYRLRKKLGLEHDEGLVEYILGI